MAGQQNRLSSYLRQGVTLMVWVAVAGPACATTWDSQPRVDPRLVARALNDTVELPGKAFNPASLPNFSPPHRLRPCCLFGMDLKVKIGALPLPGFKLGNILGPDELGPHGYDKGNLKNERNGLVYTCRGGFIDIAHVRDSADRTLYLAMQLARLLPVGFNLNLPQEGTVRRVIVKPLPPGLLARYGRWNVATALAQWANFQLGVWHEIVTWYGWDSVNGFPEKVSAFSPEDLYSNVVGQKLATGIILNHETDSRRAYNRAMDAWIPESLRRLGAVPRADGRRAMQAVDGIWWDSRQWVPDNQLVRRRYLQIDLPLMGWLVEREGIVGPMDPDFKALCPKQPGPLPLGVPQRLGDYNIADLVTVEFEFSGWLPKAFPIPIVTGQTITQAAFPAVLRDVHCHGAEELGAGFDQAARVPAPERSVAACRVASF